ncbi:cytochrome C oxidase subunit IV family protein [Thalassotalea nanhaiensis]|uniref:cytochrome C oxidase subunit IV family protein n=1 Tax=Thalassotalea nanhaiensis TaxID=3065648 RepID=UPI0038646B6C
MNYSNVVSSITKNSKTLLNTDILVWSGLILFTLISFFIGGESLFLPKLATTFILLVSFIKIRLVIHYFMEVKYAPLPLKIALDVWCICVFVMLLTLLVFPF